MVFDWDDFGANHVISDMCQSHDCRDKLDQLHYANHDFKCTLFAIPGEMTAELAEWCYANRSWVELAVHGFFHRDNYECAEMTYEEFDQKIKFFQPMLDRYFVKGFKAPGWQISDDIYRWLADHGWWVADQAYNNERRPLKLRAYVNHNGQFYRDDSSEPVDAWHGHVWDCCGNGIYETFDHVRSLVENAKEFKFVSEVLV
jgi:hypothetical protein